MLSIIIPCYNEEKRIRDNLKHILNYLEKKNPDYELIMAIDIGTDKTLDLIKGLKNKKTKMIVNRKRMGKGHAIRQGVLESKGDYIFFLDIDLSTPIEEFPKLFQYMDSYDIAIGSRALAQSKVKKRIDRKVLGIIGSFMIKTLLLKGIKDTQCGFKLFKKEPAKKLFSLQKNNGFGFDFEILFLANKLGYKIKEIPIIWAHVGGSKVTFASHFKTLSEFIKIKINDWKGMYNVKNQKH